MPYTPRPVNEVATSLNAKIVARSPLTDLTQGGPLERMTWSFAEELSLVEQRLAGIRDTFNLLNPSISLADFDERLQELPRADAIARLETTYASGAVMSVTRALVAGIQVLPAGTTFARKDTGAKYRTTTDYSFGIGVGTLTGIEVVSLQPGTAGNCAAGAINQMASGPSWVINAANISAITNGQDEENLAQAQQRMSLYFSSLAKCQPNAFEFAAPSYIGSTGSRVKFAKVFVDWEKPGFSELVVDDGSDAMGSLVKAGTVVTGIVPAMGIKQLWHEAPATAPIPSVNVTLAAGGNTVLFEGTHYTSIHERGLIHLKTGVTLQPGDVWEVTGYQVYTGILAELQRHIDGSVSDPYNNPGWVAGGCRCFVVPPVVSLVSFDIHVVPVDGMDAMAAAQDAQNTAINFLATLGPGETMFSGKLIAILMGSGLLRGVHLYQSGTNTPTGDWYCADKEVLRGNTTSIRTVPQLPA